MLQLFSLSCILTSALSFILGTFTFLKNRKASLNRYWFLVSISAGLWSLSLWRVVNAKTETVAMAWQYLLDASAIFIPVFFLMFVLVLTGEYKEKKLARHLSILGGLFLLLLSFTTLFKAGVSPIMDFNYWVVPGPLYFLFPAFFSLNVIYLIYLLIISYKGSVGIKKNQIKYILITAIIGFGGGPTNFFPQLFQIYPVGNFLVVFYVIGVAYAVTRYRLMDIKLILRKYSVYLASVTSIMLPVIALYYISYRFFPETTAALINFLVLVLALSVFPAIKNYYYRIANKYFFSSLYDSGEVIANLSDKLRSTIELNKIYQYISDTLIKSLRAKAFGIITLDEKKSLYIVKYNKGFKIGRRKRFPGNLYLRKHFIKKNKSIVVEELKRTPNKKYNETIEMINSLGAEILTPMNVKDKTVGLIVLGAKESGDMYNDEDLGVLQVISAQAAIAIENALLYEETKKFSVKLEKEVTKATAELRAANEKLKKLDKAKSEFISIASHQLRTPLTIIKGYISMMLEGSFGELTSGAIGSLGKVYESNERLIQLVENLLNISRIESGRLQFNYEVVQLEEVVDSVVEELINSAEKRGLRFIYKKPSKSLPKIKIDEEKIRQAVLNLVDNAIKYTKRGSITVSLKQVNKNIEFCVSDSGIGIKNGEFKSLFKKFFRGDGTSLIHTEGVGLGLYVARIMVEAHKGNVWAESKGRGKGSKFCFLIPINKN